MRIYNDEEYLEYVQSLKPESSGYVVHKNVKLSADQAAVIDASGEADSQWIREAVQQRIDSEE
jgi:hypothetical protein